MGNLNLGIRESGFCDVVDECWIKFEFEYCFYVFYGFSVLRLH